MHDPMCAGCFIAFFYCLKALNENYTYGRHIRGVNVHIDEFAMHQLEESIHFATTRHESKTVLNNVISVTASMQTQETKWSDSDQAFISKSRPWRISTIIDQLELLIDDPLLLSDYPTQEGSDLPAMRAWI